MPRSGATTAAGDLVVVTATSPLRALHEVLDALALPSAPSDRHRHELYLPSRDLRTARVVHGSRLATTFVARLTVTPADDVPPTPSHSGSVVTLQVVERHGDERDAAPHLEDLRRRVVDVLVALDPAARVASGCEGRPPARTVRACRPGHRDTGLGPGDPGHRS